MQLRQAQGAIFTNFKLSLLCVFLRKFFKPVHSMNDHEPKFVLPPDHLYASWPRKYPKAQNLDASASLSGHASSTNISGSQFMYLLFHQDQSVCHDAKQIKQTELDAKHG